MTTASGLRLSVLDTAPVWSDTTPATALNEAVELARAAESAGYVRYWLAEHHNTPSVASVTPAVLAARLAAATTSLRVGSGGVILPNHPPLIVAEQFGTLQALFPGRIDLGIGRAGALDGPTATALRRGADRDFPAHLAELFGYFSPADPRHPRPVQAVTAVGNAPDVWLLGSSPDSARLAGRLGLPYAFAHHFNPAGAAAAAAEYHRAFEPSPVRARPDLILAATVVVAQTDAEAARLALPVAVSMVLLRSGQPPQLLPTDAEAARYPLTPAQRAAVAERLETHVIGGPDRVRAKIAQLVEATGAAEVIATTSTHDFGARVHSYELLAKVAEEL
ncbi:conserved hypothetical protein [Frankia canadensis]|uniref:Luciferase-like domain-containing protein n=1 Tax=Frankia canadensis TaxID=1836972 RepID=A0A2I2KRN9_9ACTN|nr:LLM class flavin-dependent oxidoreductase [Frankia canadensis]SNQ48338.1 conserved hypothetical protein [Frankia canadensis]SOU55628.1 conserved hypothetical protein [Frankia canadensis]